MGEGVTQTEAGAGVPERGVVQAEEAGATC